MYTYPNKSNSRLVARCFFSKSTNSVEFKNYSRYYDVDKKK